MVNPVVKAVFLPSLVARENPANDRISKVLGLHLFLSWIAPPTLPKQARYQLRYTRIFSFSCMIPCGEEKSKFFVSVGAAVVKPDFARVFQLGNFRRKLLSQRLPGLRFQENG